MHGCGCELLRALPFCCRRQLFMRYCPILVRLSPKRPTREPHALSGCFIDTGSRHMCITVCPFSATELCNYRIHVAAPQIGEDVVWFGARVIESFGVFSEGGRGPGPGETTERPEKTQEAAGEAAATSLFDFLDKVTKSEFKLFPMASVRGAALEDMTVVHMTACVQDAFKDELRHLQIGQCQHPSRLTVQSCPFGLTSPKLFADFRSSGGVCAVFTDGYLSDCRYLENMIGGMVSLEDPALQIGLVLGSLRKTNGDGDLTVVLGLLALERLFPKGAGPLTSVLARVNGVSSAHVNTVSGALASPATSLALSSGRIWPLLLHSKKGLSWGSCVVYNERTLVTNHHVVQPLLEGLDASCFAIIGKRFLKILPDQVEVPFPGLDLAFVALCAGTLAAGLFPPIETASYTDLEAENQALSAFGYGLFLDRGRPSPLRTSGYICRTVRLAPFSRPSQGEPQHPIACMMITSTACWNGSSGGGVFDTHGRFAGLMSSNARVYMPDALRQGSWPRTEIVPDLCFTIPANLIALCYEEKVVARNPVQLSRKVVQAWNLQDYYGESFQPEAKM